mgnify:CR=1 FL=1|tara:strand:- start:210 stop:395 length:186 start_codon:yes stop_codon:yes gene_type:complete
MSDELDEGFIIEACDRVHIITEMADNFLCDQPAIVAANCQSEVDDIIATLNKIYQKLGSLE